MMKDIIIAPVITEKSQIAISSNNVYTFKVSKDANKTQIKQAIEEAFGVNLTIAKASFTSFPLIKSATTFTFLGEILAKFRVATASCIFVSSTDYPSLNII